LLYRESIFFTLLPPIKYKTISTFTIYFSFAGTNPGNTPLNDSAEYCVQR